MAKKRTLPKERSLSRSKPKRQPGCRYIIFCEGKITEPQYLRDFAKAHRNELVRVIPVGVGKDPSKVLEDAISRKGVEHAKAKTSGNSFDTTFSIWCIVDTDDHQKLNSSRQQAKKAGIGFCISNPCFELWVLLHKQDHRAYISSADVQNQLNKALPSYRHSKKPIIPYAEIHHFYSCAHQRAVALKSTNSSDNPSTDIYRLLEKIRAK